MKIVNQPGKKIHEYIFVKELGKGAFGQVFSAKNERTGQIVAVKCVLKSKLSDHQGLVGQLFQSEVEVLQQIDHPHVVKLVQYLESQNQCYLVLEFCNSGDFEKLWDSRGRKFPEQEAIGYMKQILLGMQALHQYNVLHRDLKLANILVHDQMLKIADLGFCKKLSNKDQVETLSLGSLGNMAPEVVEQKPYGMAADMFSIGSIFYQLLFGTFPFTNSSAKNFLAEISNRPPDFKRNNIRISSELEVLIARMLLKDPEQRLKWQELYSHPLMQAKADLRLQELSINQLAANELDPKKMRDFYGVKESQLFPKNENQNPAFIQQKQPFRKQQVVQCEEIETTADSQNDLVLQQQEEINAQQEVTQIVEKYLRKRDQIVFLSRTLNQISKVKHSKQTQGLMPQLMLAKQITELSEVLLKQLLNKENIFETRYLERVYKNEYFKKFLEMSIDNDLFYRDTFKFYLEVANAHREQMKLYVQQEWLLEMKEEPSTEFELFFRDILINYIFVLNDTKNEEQIEKEKEIIVDLQIHLVQCLQFQNKKVKQQHVDVEKHFESLSRLNFLQKQAKFDQLWQEAF